MVGGAMFVSWKSGISGQEPWGLVPWDGFLLAESQLGFLCVIGTGSICLKNRGRCLVVIAPVSAGHCAVLDTGRMELTPLNW
jgi:hypothetical protein